MTVTNAHIVNAGALISMGLWGYLDVTSPTALIPVGFGAIILLLVLLSMRFTKLSGLFLGAAVAFTLLITVALVGVRLPKSLDAGGMGLIRVLIMVVTSGFALGSSLRAAFQSRSK